MRIPNPKPHIELEFHVLNELQKNNGWNQKIDPEIPIRKSGSGDPEQTKKGHASSPVKN